jgi:hypothetical protein
MKIIRPMIGFSLESTSSSIRRTLLSFERPRRAGQSGDRGSSRAGRAPVRVHLENSIATTQRVLTDQENKSTRWMPWRQEPMKDVGGCDKPGGDADQSLIPGFPNGETYAW